MSVNFINTGAEEMEVAIQSGMLKRGHIPTAVDVSRYQSALNPVFPEMNTQEQKDRGLQQWQEFWQSMSMVLLGYLDPLFQKVGKNQAAGRCDPKIFDYVMTKAGASRSVITVSRRKKLQVMVQYTLKEDLEFFQQNVPQNPGRNWINIAPGINVVCPTRKRFTELKIKQNVATYLVEFDYKYVCEYYNFEQKKWLETI